MFTFKYFLVFQKIIFKINTIPKTILTSQDGFRNRIDFENIFLKNQKIVKGEHVLYYNTKKYKQKGSFNILNKISEDITLVQLMDYIGNANHAIIVVG